MGKINTVILLGRIASKIRYKENKNTKELVSVKFALQVSRRQYANEDGALGGSLLLSAPFILSRNKDIMKKMLEMSEGDIVILKGNLCTKELTRIICCPNEDCEYEEQIDNSTIIYVDPVFILKLAHIEDKEEANHMLLKDLPEISNQVLIEGRLCTDVDYYADPNGKFRKSEYCIAVSRPRIIREDEKSVATDKPWVQSFGKIALEDSSALRTGSLITINGAIMTVSFNKTHECKLCGAEITEKRTVTKIVPYSVEYRENCIKPESTHKKQGGEDETDQSVRQTEPAE